MYKEIVLSVIKTSLPIMIVLIILQYIFRKQSTCILIEFNVAYSIVRMMPLVNSMHTLGIKGIITLIICFLFMNTSTLLGSLTVVSIFSLTKSLKTLIISMLLSFFIVKFVKLYVGICRNVWYNSCRR